MGQTLTHGIYLPDEGERNCYSGLAANWQILDTSVGTIAEHTTQIAGKASASHSHGNITNDGKVGTTANVPLITGTGGVVQTGSFGNSANTFCEGNDSRLSDARTPVAHTHTKSDVTDLLNSNFIPSANNSYDLGSSSYQWNNLYAKGYYYNGVAWGLDKYNQWTGVNDFNDLMGLNGAELWFKQPNIEDITTNPSTDAIKSILQIWNRATTQYCGGIINGLMADGTHKLTISCLGFPLNNYGGYYPHSFSFEAKRDGTASFSPNYINASLGTSSAKWKTLNGVNPGALSFPSSDSADYIDLSDDLSTNAEYIYTAPYDGWLCLYVIVNEFYPENAVGLFRSDTSANSHQWAKSVTAALNMYKQNKYQGSVMLPVESGKKYICYISLNANTIITRKQLFFYKNKGNV